MKSYYNNLMLVEKELQKWLEDFVELGAFSGAFCLRAEYDRCGLFVL